VVLNDVTWSIVKAQRSLHPLWVFPYRGRRINTMNNNGWQEARRDAGLPLVASMIFATRSRVGCERQAFPPKIAKHCSVMPIIQWPVIMRAPMLVTC
jgi:hypothetical protein